MRGNNSGGGKSRKLGLLKAFSMRSRPSPPGGRNENKLLPRFLKAKMELIILELTTDYLYRTDLLNVPHSRKRPGECNQFGFPPSR